VTYEELGVRPVINAAATLTKLGGSLLAPGVIEAMAAGAANFVDIGELHTAVGARLAELTGNEAGYICSGAAAGIMLSIVACIAGVDPELREDFPQLRKAPKTEVVLYRSQRNGYDYAARQTGATIVEIDADPDALINALSERTACVMWFAGAHFADGALPIEQVVAIVHPRGIPVLVDAAAQIPPISSLWHFTSEVGADAVLVSGGKGLRGPQPTGLILGRQFVIDGARANSSPNHAIGRPMKVGKEEVLGLLAAVEWSLKQNEKTTIAGYERSVQGWISAMAGIPGVMTWRDYPSEAGQPHGRAMVQLDPELWDRDRVIAALWDGEPRIAVSAIGADKIALNPQTLRPGEDEIVLTELRHVLTKGD